MRIPQNILELDKILDWLSDTPGSPRRARRIQSAKRAFRRALGKIYRWVASLCGFLVRHVDLASFVSIWCSVVFSVVASVLCRFVVSSIVVLSTENLPKTVVVLASLRSSFRFFWLHFVVTSFVMSWCCRVADWLYHDDVQKAVKIHQIPCKMGSNLTSTHPKWIQNLSKI